MSIGHLVADHYSKTNVPTSHPDYAILDQDDVRVKQVVELSMLYTAQVLTAYEYQHEVKKIFPYKRSAPSAAQLRKKLVSGGKRFVGMRYFLFSMSKFKRPDRKRFRSLARSLEVNNHDAEFALGMYTRDEHFRAGIVSKATQFAPSQYSTAAFSDIDRQYLNIEPQLRRHIRHIVDRKLAYLVRFGIDERDNLIGELMYAALCAYYKKVPCSFTEDHLLNYLRRVVTNAAKNIANAYSTQKRNEVIRQKSSGEGFDTYHALTVRPQEYEQDGELIQPVELGVVNEERNLHFDIFLVHMADRLRNMPRKLRFLRLLAGWDDPKFTAWLHEHRYIRKGGSCVDFCDRTDPNVYVEVVRQHCRVSKKAATKFLAQLRQEFSEQGMYR